VTSTGFAHERRRTFHRRIAPGVVPRDSLASALHRTSRRPYLAFAVNEREASVARAASRLADHQQTMCAKVPWPVLAIDAAYEGMLPLIDCSVGTPDAQHQDDLMANISDDERKSRLLAAVPKDGSSIGNTYLARQLGWSLDVYFKVRNGLVTDGRLEIGRGRGGSVRLIVDTPSTSAPPARKPRNEKERSLYAPFLGTLKIWSAGQGWHDHVVQQTSDQGAKATGGRYTRPDFVVIGIKKYEYTPGVVRDIETFEVKPLGATIDAVFEAAAHSRAATKSYLALEVAENQPTEDEIARFESECQRFGLGLLTFVEPTEWHYLVDPVRREPDPELVDQFFRAQILPVNQERIRKQLR
jgi:hypothetical protein